MKPIPSAAKRYTDQSLSSIHHTLRASRRRLVVSLVFHRTLSADELQGPSDSESVITVRQLAKEIVAIEEDIPVEHATGDSYHNVYTSLIQTHLSELDDVGAITYDADRKEVYPDSNLIALSMVAAVTSPVAQMLFHNAVTNISGVEVASLQDSTSD